jgi:RimJ/RimL family protein N-acetyltransferase
MEKMPFRETADSQAARTGGPSPQSASPDWRTGLPVLYGPHVTLREVRVSDAPSLHAMLTTEEVVRFIAPPATTVDGLERFIARAHAQRTEGTYICFALIPEGHEEAVGLFQVRQLEPGFGSAEWSFAVGFPFWGSGIFVEAGRLVLDFVFAELGARRVEARVAVANGRGGGAVKKIGAVQEGILRKSLFRDGVHVDQFLWTILDEDWRLVRTGRLPRIH